MPSLRIPKHNNTGCYFATLTGQQWYYIFDRKNRWNILADALNYCVEHKGLQIYGYVFMLNHIHLLFFSSDSAGFIRDYKAFTTKLLKENITKTEPNLLELFCDDAGAFQIWQSTNMPLYVETDAFFIQKLQYIYENPVKKTYVINAEDWYWWSACKYSPVKLASMFS